MRYLAAITMLILALAIMPPVAAQSFKPNIAAGEAAYFEEDYATALKHFRPLAEQGDARAQFWLGQMHRFAQGVTKNYKEAVKWSSKGAVQGNADAQHQLGYMYSVGQGVLQDLVMAYVWLNIAITNGVSSPKVLMEYRDDIRAKLTASELKLARKLSKLCFRKPANCPEYSDD